jgi:hypothetical protein
LFLQIHGLVIDSGGHKPWQRPTQNKIINIFIAITA